MKRLGAGFKQRVIVFLVATACASFGSRSQAAEDFWIAAGGGGWDTNSRWLDGTAPTSDDDAIFNLSGTYLVTFPVPPAPIDGLKLRNSANVTFGITSAGSTSTTLEVGFGDVDLSDGAALTLGRTFGLPLHLTCTSGLNMDVGTTLNVDFDSDVYIGSIVESNGQINVTNAGSTITSRRQFLSYGTVNVTLGGLIQNLSGYVYGVMNVSGVGSRWLNSGLLTIGRALTVSGPSNGTLSITGGGLVENLNASVGDGSDTSGTVTVTGSGSRWVTTNDLEIGRHGPGTVNIQPGGTVAVGHDTVIDTAGRLRLLGGVFDTGEFHQVEGGLFEWSSGTYRVGMHHGSLLNQSGTLAPGHSAGSTTILGDYEQRAGGTLEIEIGGDAQGTQHDVVNVVEDALLGGQLDVKLIDAFVPTPSQIFIIMSAGTVSGTFDNAINGQRLATADGSGSFLVNYGPSSAFDPALVVLSNFLSGSLPGDYNQNGIVDAGDYTRWRDTLGQNVASGTGADGDGDGTISDADYTVWKSHFGSDAASSSTASVPEPATYTVVIIALLVVRLRR